MKFNARRGEANRNGRRNNRKQFEVKTVQGREGGIYKSIDRATVTRGLTIINLNLIGNSVRELIFFYYCFNSHLTQNKKKKLHFFSSLFLVLNISILCT